MQPLKTSMCAMPDEFEAWLYNWHFPSLYSHFSFGKKRNYTVLGLFWA